MVLHGRLGHASGGRCARTQGLTTAARSSRASRGSSFDDATRRDGAASGTATGRAGRYARASGVSPGCLACDGCASSGGSAAGSRRPADDGSALSGGGSADDRGAPSGGGASHGGFATPCSARCIRCARGASACPGAAPWSGATARGSRGSAHGSRYGAPARPGSQHAPGAFLRAAQASDTPAHSRPAPGRGGACSAVGPPDGAGARAPGSASCAAGAARDSGWRACTATRSAASTRGACRAAHAAGHDACAHTAGRAARGGAGRTCLAASSQRPSAPVAGGYACRGTAGSSRGIRPGAWHRGAASGASARGTAPRWSTSEACDHGSRASSAGGSTLTLRAADACRVAGPTAPSGRAGHAEPLGSARGAWACSSRGNPAVHGHDGARRGGTRRRTSTGGSSARCSTAASEPLGGAAGGCPAPHTFSTSRGGSWGNGNAPLGRGSCHAACRAASGDAPRAASLRASRLRGASGHEPREIVSAAPRRAVSRREPHAPARFASWRRGGAAVLASGFTRGA